MQTICGWILIYIFCEMWEPFSNCNSNENRNTEIIRRIDFACFVQIPLHPSNDIVEYKYSKRDKSEPVCSFVHSLVHSNVWMWLANKSHSTRECGCLLQSTVIYLRINWVKCWCIECTLYTARQKNYISRIWHRHISISGVWETTSVFGTRQKGWREKEKNGKLACI